MQDANLCERILVHTRVYNCICARVVYAFAVRVLPLFETSALLGRFFNII